MSIAVEPCVGEIEVESVAFIGRRFRFVCSCGTRTPLASKEQAELARDRHDWELHRDKEAEA